MTLSNQPIYAPNIYLFAFQQQKEFFIRNSTNSLSPEWLTSKYSQILNCFYACQTIKLNQSSSFNSLITQPQKFLGTIKNQQDLEVIAGEAYPQEIEDNYIMSLRIEQIKRNADQPISLKKLADFNPKNCFLPQKINTNLGQTVVITALLASGEYLELENLQSLATNCVSSFYQLLDMPGKLVLISSGTLFNSYVFAYHLPEDLCQYNQTLVCLFVRQEDRDNLHKHHHQLAKLLLSAHKLTYVHQHSRNLFELACHQIRQLQYSFKSLNNNYFNQNLFSNDFENNSLPILDQNTI